MTTARQSAPILFIDGMVPTAGVGQDVIGSPPLEDLTTAQVAAPRRLGEDRGAILSRE